MSFLFFLRHLLVVTAVCLAIGLLTGCGMKSVLVEGTNESSLSNRGDDSIDGGSELPNCGNGVIEKNLGEFCDGTNFGGATCRSLGRAPGVLQCTNKCLLDVTFCGSSGPIGDGSIGDGGGMTRLGDGGNLI